MNEVLQAKTAESVIGRVDSEKPAALRVSPNNYAAALFLGIFFSGFLFYLEFDRSGIALLIFSFVVWPWLAFGDRIVFDGKRLRRTGILPRSWSALNGFYYHLKIYDIEQVETQSLRAIKRGGNVFYRYRTKFSGKGRTFVIASGGEDYRRMVRRIFSRLPENVLDSRSLELRDYLSEPKETLMKAEFVHIPSADVLEDSLKAFLDLPAKQTRQRTKTGGDSEKAVYLRRLANELRLSGHLLQALEAFRRALLINPHENWLLFEFARCLNSYASAERNEKLHRKAFALLRLAESRARTDGELLARLGESYFQFGEWERAQKVFQKSLETFEKSFRAARGMAEIALREGKIAHVILNFGTANRFAETPALKRWAQNEAAYFSHLNNDEDYMEMEISRINLLETLERSKKNALRVAMIGFPTILTGLVFDDALITNIGWAVSAVALVIWAAMIFSIRLFAERIPYDMIEES